MQEGRDDLFLVKPVSAGKIQQVDPVEIAVLTFFDQLRNGVDHRRIGGLPQDGELGLGVAHMMAYRGMMENIGDRSGCVVTTPIGITGALSTRPTRNAAIIFASASVASTSAKCAPMQTRAPTPNGR